MLQTVVIFTLYFFLFTWLITRISFFKNVFPNSWWLVTLFAIKIAAGLAYAFFYLQPTYYATSDTWHYFELSKGETDWLLKDPLAFFKDIFLYGYQQSGSLFGGENSYWNDLKSNIVIKLIAICNVFTFKDYYADIIFFNFLFFFGPVALYKVMKKLFAINNLLLTACIFMLPSFLFWCSGVHKDGLIFSCICVIIFHFYKQLTERKLNVLSLIISVFCFIVLFALRNFTALLFLPALFVWFLCNTYPAKARLIAVLFYGIGAVLFFLSAHISSKINLPQYVIEKQGEFKKLSGTSQIQIPELENSVSSFIMFLPAAIDIAFFRPHVDEIRNKGYIPAVTEVICLWGVAIFSLFKRSNKTNSGEQKAFLIFCLCFSVSFLLLAGYTIPFSGAIVRYRAVVLPFLFIPLLQSLNFDQFNIFKKSN